MPSKRLDNLRNRIANDPAASHCGLRSESPEPTTEKGTRRHHAELDTPPPGEEESSLIVTGPRSRKPTEDSAYYRAMRERSRSRSEKLRAHSNPRSEGNVDASSSCLSGSGAPKIAGRRRSAPSRPRPCSPSVGEADCSDNRGRSTEVRRLGPRERTSTGRPIASNNRVRLQQAENRKAAEERERRQRAYELRHRIARSPSPGSEDGGNEDEECDGECEQMLEDEIDELDKVPSSPPPIQPTSESQYTYIFETAGYQTLAAYAEAKLGGSFQGWAEEDIYEAIQIVESDQAHQVSHPEPETEVVLLETQPLRVGGGWHRKNEPAPGSQLGKRAPNSSTVDSSIKRARKDDPNDTATEPETDEDEPMAPADAPVTPPAPPPLPAPAPAVETQASHPPIATLAREDTAATVLDAPLEGQPPPSSPSLGGRPSRFPTIPEFLAPIKSLPCGPVHERLRRKVEERANARRRPESSKESDQSQSTGSPPPPPPPPPSPTSSPPTPTIDSPPSAPSAPNPPRTYGQVRSHVGSNSQPAPDAPGEPQPSPSRPSCSNSRSVLELLTDRSGGRYNPIPTRAEMKAARAEAKARARLFGHRAEPSAPPRDSFSLQPPIEVRPRGGSQSSRNSSGSQSSRRLHPVAAARADMAAFDERCARDNAPSFTESVTRQTSRAPRGYAALPRLLSELLPDEEEDIAHAEAVAADTQPPLARDSHGIRRQILTYAKLHLFAYALVEGMYQTRATYLLWAAYVHEATWKLMLPHVPYSAATQAELEVLVNYIATLRGKLKDRVRTFIEQRFHFDLRVVTQEDIQRNLDIFNEIYPNSFHCTSSRPRKGHFEGEQLARCIAAALFHGPNSVGVLFPDYFEDMPLTVVAFILAVMQFCIEEWSDGYFKSRDLGASHMLDKYEAHLTNLKELRSIAPRRLQRMQASWTEYAFDYSGASFIRDGKDREQAAFHAEMRADTPEPEALGESPAQSSRGGTGIRAVVSSSSMVVPDDSDCGFFMPLGRSPNPFLDDPPRASTPRNAESRSPSPLPEYNEYGCRTADSTGKGRAT